MTSEALRSIIAGGETLDVEFKSEEARPLSDGDLVDAVVCLANRPGEAPGWLLVGVEEDGRITAARPRHHDRTDPLRVQALVANRTRPSISVRAELVQIQGLDVLAIQVPASRWPLGKANIEFARLVAEESQAERPLSLDDLLLLNHLWTDRRLAAAEAAALLQKPEVEARARLEHLVETGLAEPRGEHRGLTWHLSAATYRRLGEKAAYVRQRGFEPLQQEQMVLQYVEKHGRITRAEAAELCSLSPDQAYPLLDRLTESTRLTRHGAKKGAWYERRA